MTLDLTSLRKSIESLDNSINSYMVNKENKSLSDIDMETLKAGVIQNFEVAYELCWKFLKRWLSLNVSPNIADGVYRRELFRICAEHRLIFDVDIWMSYHEARNLTSHTYDSVSAEKVFETSLVFIHDAKILFETLEVKNG
ncbi:nucleotidyltransferase substrate binding protein [Candidatus Omnitrophus magneticus]|uniref:Nucleotidyltransferase substrate binding protein n=1 Tax=Candidatus Omnitrophus magneticus TaxID=1609969 RepID=A0A0F0CJ72_9BACT|nr:nucleotidyltransferase substrate binding protein [Candidatus Omnitrophus magneticus]